MWNLHEADSVEELAELAASFLTHELQGERALVVHGDEHHPQHVTQAVEGLTLHDVETIQWDWADAAKRSREICYRASDPSTLVAPLFADQFLGFLFVRRSQPFDSYSVDELAEFASEYGHVLSRRCRRKRLAVEPEIFLEEPEPELRPVFLQTPLTPSVEAAEVPTIPVEPALAQAAAARDIPAPANAGHPFQLVAPPLPRTGYSWDQLRPLVLIDWY